MKECMYCKSKIADGATVCPHCRREQKKKRHVGLGIVALIVGIILMLSGTGMLESCLNPTLTFQGEMTIK